MADKIYVGSRARRFDTAPRFSGYDMVILYIDDENYISSPYVTIDASKWSSRDNAVHTFTYNGTTQRWVYQTSNLTTAQLSSQFGLAVVCSSVTTIKDGDTITVEKSTDDGEATVTATLSRSGHTLEGNCPLVKASQRQTIADNLLAKVYGKEYQPFEGENIRINPAAEIGDAITAFGIYGGIYSMDTSLGRLVHASISAPAEEEIDYEFQFKSEQERRYSRRFAELESEFTIQAGLISAKVSKTGGSTQSFGWEMEEDHYSIFSNGVLKFKIDEDEAYFAGVVRANQIIVGSAIIGGQTVDAGYILGSQIGQGTITGGSGGNIGEYTVEGGWGGNIHNTVIGDNMVDNTVTSLQVDATIGSGVTGGLSAADMFALRSSEPVWASTFRLGTSGTQYLEKTISFIDGNNQTRTYYVLARAGT